MLVEGVQLLLVGVVVVFLFLGLLVLILHLLAHVAGETGADGEPGVPTRDQRARVAAAIAVAFTRRRRR